MRTSLKHHSDYDTRAAVEAELRWAPELSDAEDIGVAIFEGIVRLTGEVPTYAQKIAAGTAALQAAGVTAVVNQLSVRCGNEAFSDARLARDAKDALRLNALVPRDGIEIEVRSHVIHLSGAADWDYQRRVAQQAVEALRGAHGVVNAIVLRPRVAAGETHDKIRKALVRNANIDARRINVSVDGTAVTLTGTVSSHAQRTRAEIVAWASPNIKTVHNELAIQAL